ncbi:MAG TPA: DUF2333 family protein [Gammaproteobacteria bacterium]|nr:DUF2333 family protein [Gammaproteobacteria bacterium]
MFEGIKTTLAGLARHLGRWAGAAVGALGRLYHPRTWRERGLVWTTALAAATLVVVLYIVGIYWSQEPAPFDVRENALAMAGGDQSRVVPGSTTTAALIRVAQTVLDKPGGYLSNDVMPPTSLFGTYQMLDNMPNWEFGAVVMIRDTARVLRNDFSRSQSQSLEDPDLAEAEPHFNFDANSWLFPPTEREYRKGIDHLQRYLARLSDPKEQKTQFYTRADNLNELLAVVGKRLGGLTQRLNASVEELRVNTDLAGDTAAQQSTQTSALIVARTPWMQVDDVYYESRGYVWALLEVLRAVEVDFHGVLKKKNAVASLRQVIRLLEQTQVEPSSPVVLNGAPMGWLANYSKTMVSYMSPANAAIIDLRNLLAEG